MPDYQQLPLSRKIPAIDSGSICKTQFIDESYQHIAGEIRAIARELRKARTAEAKREVLAALLWQADSIRRTLIAEQKALLNRMSERPQ